MECPKCQARMEVVRFEDIEVDRCVRCGGLWFDVLEDEELRGRAGSEAIDTGPTWQAAMHDVQGKVFCPIDGGPDGSDGRRGSIAHLGGILPGVPRHLLRRGRVHGLQGAHNRGAPPASAARTSPVGSGDRPGAT
jgi:Zn-finger nucleic acid-binding protein